MAASVEKEEIQKEVHKLNNNNNNMAFQHSAIPTKTINSNSDIFIDFLYASINSSIQSLNFILKKRLWDMCFLVNFEKFLRPSFLTEHLRWLLLSTKSSLFPSCLKTADVMLKSLLSILPVLLKLYEKSMFKQMSEVLKTFSQKSNVNLGDITAHNNASYKC